MKRSYNLLLALFIAISADAVVAEGNKVVREVGRDGVPVITIKGSKSPPATERVQRTQTTEPKQKEWKVYELKGDTHASPNEEESKPTVIVVGSPPPIAPNYGNDYRYNYYHGYNYGYPGYWYRPHPGYCTPYSTGTTRFPTSYQNRPLNYQNPPLNYQNPPSNYRPIPRSQNGHRNYRR